MLKIYLIENLSLRLPKRNFQRKKSYVWQQNRLNRSGLNWRGSGELLQSLQSCFSSLCYKTFIQHILLFSIRYESYSIIIFSKVMKYFHKDVCNSVPGFHASQSHDIFFGKLPFMFINLVPSLVYRHEFCFLLERLFFCHGNHYWCVLCEVHAEAKATAEYCGAWLSWLLYVLSMRFVPRQKKQFRMKHKIQYSRPQTLGEAEWTFKKCTALKCIAQVHF